MKITEETKIKDLLPEGYELDTNSSSSFLKSHNATIAFTCDMQCIPLKKKEVKDFNWYVEQYTSCPKLGVWIGTDDCIILKKCIITSNYKNVPFEIKIGLLKFICDDRKISANEMFNYLHYKNVRSCSLYDNISKDIPKEFIDSIFE